MGEMKINIFNKLKGGPFSSEVEATAFNTKVQEAIKDLKVRNIRRYFTCNATKVQP